MQAVKNLLHSNKDHEDTTSHHTATGTSGAAGVGNTSQPGYNTASSGVGSIGSTTGDNTSRTLPSSEQRNTSGLTHDNNDLNRAAGSGAYNTESGYGASSATPTNTAATEGTGLTGTRHADTTHGGSGRASSHLDHAHGHDHSVASKFDPTASNTTHDHKHLDHVTHRDVRHQEVEEVLREREHDRHIHHVQHHVQPVLDKQVNDEVHHQNTVPVTKIEERHTSTQEDRGLFENLASQHRDTETHRAKERTVVDLGERVHENVHHHVHHVTQPVVEQEVVDRHKIHTVIPTHHVTHEAPIIHKSSTHEPVTLDAFKAGGGKLGSGIKHDQAGVLNTEECSRSVDGVGERLAQELHLGSTGTGSGVGSGLTGSHSANRDLKDREGERQHADGSYGSGKHEARDGERHRTSVGQKLDDSHVTN